MRIDRKLVLAGLLACWASATTARTLPLPADGSRLVGTLDSAYAREEDTLIDLARVHNQGYEELKLANPGVDPWLPGVGTVVVLPNRYILPDVPYEGVVVNAPEMRLYHFVKPKNGMPTVTTYPVSIGRDDWRTPIGATKVTGKVKNPSWNVPESIRAEHAAFGDILPKVVPPGPDNPLGSRVLRLGFASYLIHGTNNPNGLGMRVTHGCIRLYPQDIEALFERVPEGAPVRFINQPYKVAVEGGAVYVEAHPLLEEDQAQRPAFIGALTEAVQAAGRSTGAQVDWALLRGEIDQPSGIPVRISRPAPAGMQAAEAHGAPEVPSVTDRLF